MAPEAQWDEVALYDVAEYINGRATKPSERTTDGVPVVKIAELTRGITERTDRVPRSAVLKRHWISSGNLLFAWSGSVGVYRYHGPDAALNQHIFRVEAAAGFDDRYVEYLLISQLPRFEAVVADKRTTMGHVTVRDLKTMHVRVPPLGEQRHIASHLASLDDKIELHQRMNRVLEKMARAIFKAWFIDFEPVKAKAEGATSFPGMPQDVFDQLPDRLVESDLGQVPQEWPVQTVSDIADYINGKAFTKHANGQGRMIIRIAELNSAPGGATKYTNVETEPEYTAFPDDILFAWSGSLDVYRWHRDEAIINQHIFKVVPKDYPKWYVYYRLVEAMPFFQSIASTKATTMGHIKRGHLSDALFAAPPNWLVEAAEDQIRPLYDLVHCNERETFALANTRDTLLPKLISGELRLAGGCSDE